MLYVVIGGGCWGSFHTRLLLKAHDAGRIALNSVVVVDRNPAPPARAEFGHDARARFAQADWLEWYVAEIDRLPPSTQIVPAPIAPHLACQWLLRTAAPRLPGHALDVVPMAHCFGLPYEHLAPDGCRYISAAAWACPTTCRAPAICPAIQAERTWDLGAILRALAASSEAGIDLALVFQGEHQAFGLETISVARLLEARDRFVTVAAQPPPRRLMVATISPCHGVVNLVEARSRRAADELGTSSGAAD